MDSNSAKYYSSKQEKMIADHLGWSVVTGSGSRSTHPGDVESDEWLGECKTHKGPGHKIKFDHSVWKKIVDEAASKYKFPVLFVDDGSQTMRNTWCMFHTSPSVECLSTNYLLPVKSNIIFDSSVMEGHRKSIQTDKPVIYVVKNSDKVVFISTFNDFVDMFRIF